MKQSMHIEPRFAELLTRAGLTDGQALFAQPIGEAMTKPGLDIWRDRRRLTLTDGTGRRETAYLKRYLHPPLGAQIRRILWRSPGRGTAWWEWRASSRLASAAVPTPVPMAFGEQMVGWWERRSFLLVKAADSQALERWLPEGWRRLAPRQKRAWLEQLARLVARFHAAGFCHRDFYLSHVFVDAADLDQPRFCLIDLQRVFTPRWRKRRWRVKDLAQLNYSAPAGPVTRADRWRFLRSYVPGASREERRRWAESTEHKTQQIAGHDARRRARLGARTKDA
jgi:hypothetical protein